MSPWAKDHVAKRFSPSHSTRPDAIVSSLIWLVSFVDYDLGYIDLKEKTLQPLDNPFGLRV
jgi:hypothetical protein